MASLRDKLKSKIKPKVQPETMECFDQTSLNVNLIQGKNQLTEIKIHCAWNNNKYNIKAPKLKCQWYNRTEKNYQQIIGIQDQTYQPSILDVSSIIEVTCIPELPGVSYQGMPILLKSQPIVLASETESQAKRIQQKAKGKFIVNLIEMHLGGNFNNGAEALLQYQKGQLSIQLLKVADSNNHLVKVMEITEQYPAITISRKDSRKVTMKFSQQESCVVLFKNNEVRDSFCLFLKLFQAQKALRELQHSEIVDPQKEQVRQEVELSHNEGKIEQKDRCEQKLTSKTDQRQQPKENISSEYQISVRQSSTTDLLQLLSLKQENKRLQAQNSKNLKQLQSYKQKAYSLQNSLLQSNERVQNASKNYFTLEQELAKSLQIVNNLRQQIKYLKQHESSKQEEFLYYTTEIKLINEQKCRLQAQVQELQKNHRELVEEVKDYRELYGSGESRSYKELMDELKRVQEINCELKLKNQFYLEERDKLEEAMKSSRQVMQQMQAEKKYIEKKYESLTNELSSSSVSPTSPKKDRSNQNSLSCSFIYEEALPPLESRESFLKIINADSQNRQRELLDLQRQLKECIQQNNYLRSLLSKEKKPSSKTQLKLQLMQAKKIVGRLSEAIGQKQSMLANLRQINKEINRRNQNLEQHCQQLVQQLQNSQ